jgi:hypothetical protein
MKTLSDLATFLDHEISSLSVMPDDQLEELMVLVERAYIHSLIERSLRGKTTGSVSSIKKK